MRPRNRSSTLECQKLSLKPSATSWTSSPIEMSPSFGFNPQDSPACFTTDLWPCSGLFRRHLVSLISILILPPKCGMIIRVCGTEFANSAFFEIFETPQNVVHVFELQRFAAKTVRAQVRGFPFCAENLASINQPLTIYRVRYTQAMLGILVRSSQTRKV